MICRLSKKKDNLKYNKKYPDGMRKIFDNKVIKSLGWKPRISLEEGLSKQLNGTKKTVFR